MDRTDQTATADEIVTAAIAGDEPAFAALTERHRRELHVHCYRMLASFDEAEDAVQETFLNAWRGRSGFEGGSQFRAWLYRIATNVCLDMLRRNSRRATGMRSFAEVPWIQPYPDLLLDQAAPADEQPEAVAIQRETISLAFLAALQVLPPRQRAALIARDVLGWPASETAAALGTSVAAANSALQRARATMQSHLPPRRAEWSAHEPTARGTCAARAVHRRARTARRRGRHRARRAGHPDHHAAPARGPSTGRKRSGRSWPRRPRWATGG